MKLLIQKKNLLNYTVNQLNFFFNDGTKVSSRVLKKPFNIALERIENCFKAVNNNYYQKLGISIFNHLNSDHFCTFLYFLSNSCYSMKLNSIICEKIYYLNKILHSVDIFYEVELPDIFLLVHPIGTVLGRAKYSNYFVVYQGCNVGSNKNEKPIFEKYVTLRPNSSVMGKSKIYENSVIAAHSLILNQNVKKNLVYIGNPKKFYHLKNKEKYPCWK